MTTRSRHADGVVTALVSLLVLAAAANADTLVFQQGGANGATSDTFLTQAFPDTDRSASFVVEWDGSDFGGQNIGLVRFDEVFGDGDGGTRLSNLRGA